MTFCCPRKGLPFPGEGKCVVHSPPTCSPAFLGCTPGASHCHWACNLEAQSPVGSQAKTLRTHPQCSRAWWPSSAAWCSRPEPVGHQPVFVVKLPSTHRPSSSPEYSPLLKRVSLKMGSIRGGKEVTEASSLLAFLALTCYPRSPDPSHYL